MYIFLIAVKFSFTFTAFQNRFLSDGSNSCTTHKETSYNIGNGVQQAKA